MRVVGLYRYPVKGFTPEKCAALSIAAGGRIVGDRVLGFRFANAAISDDAWGTKHEFVALVNTPGLARLELQFDHKTLGLKITSRNKVIVDEALNDGSRRRVATAIEKYVLGLAENPLSAHPDRIPLRLVGDGVTPRYQDNPAGFVTLHSRESLAALAAAANASDLSELRFRSNIAVDGVEAWAEQAWIGRKLRIGAIDFEVAAPKTRCLATHANPSSGERDLPIMRILLKAFAAEKPTFAIALKSQQPGGTIHIGDQVTIQ